MNLDDVIRKHSSVEVDKAIRAENNLHKETLKPLNEDLKSTYAFMPDSMYDSYVRKIERKRQIRTCSEICSFLL